MLDISIFLLYWRQGFFCSQNIYLSHIAFSINQNIHYTIYYILYTIYYILHTILHTILPRHAMIFPRFFLLGRDFILGQNFKISFGALLSASRTKIWIGIAVQHQDACIVESQRLHSSEGYIYYVLVHDRRNWSDMDPNGKLFYAWSEE